MSRLTHHRGNSGRRECPAPRRRARAGRSLLPLGEGLHGNAIAERLGVSIRTQRNRVASIEVD